MEIEKKNELVDICVLSLIKKEGSYGYGTFKGINEYTKISEAELYCILKKLEQDGKISSYSMEYSNRLRKYYSLTEKGSAYVESFLNKWQEIAAVYNFATQERNEKKRRWL